MKLNTRVVDFDGDFCSKEKFRSKRNRNDGEQQNSKVAKNFDRKAIREVKFG